MSKDKFYLNLKFNDDIIKLIKSIQDDENLYKIKDISKNNLSNKTLKLNKKSYYYKYDNFIYSKIRSNQFSKKYKDFEEKFKSLYKKIKEVIKNEIGKEVIEVEDETNKYIINYYNNFKYIAPHKDFNDIVCIIVLSNKININNIPTSVSDESLFVIENQCDDGKEITGHINDKINELNESNELTFRRNILKSDNILCIKIEIGNGILLYGGSYFHFVIPSSAEKISVVFNYNIKKD